VAATAVIPGRTRLRFPIAWLVLAAPTPSTSGTWPPTAPSRHVHHGVGYVGRQRGELGGGAEDEDRVDLAEEPSELTLERRPVEGAVGPQRRDQWWDGSGDKLHGWTSFLEGMSRHPPKAGLPASPRPRLSEGCGVVVEA